MPICNPVRLRFTLARFDQEPLTLSTACGHTASSCDYFIDFAQINAFLASRCSASRKRNNDELPKIGEKGLCSVHVHTL
jgi:hypothetical protein